MTLGYRAPTSKSHRRPMGSKRLDFPGPRRDALSYWSKTSFCHQLRQDFVSRVYPTSSYNQSLAVEAIRHQFCDCLAELELNTDSDFTVTDTGPFTLVNPFTQGWLLALHKLEDGVHYFI